MSVTDFTAFFTLKHRNLAKTPGEGHVVFPRTVIAIEPDAGERAA